MFSSNPDKSSSQKEPLLSSTGSEPEVMRPSDYTQERQSFVDRKKNKMEVFERKSIKLWVPNQKVSAVVAIMQRYVPIHRRGMVHSVYVDSENGAMYGKRLVREEDSKLLRFRWYGDDEPSAKSQVFVELKTHKNKKPSSKERFALSPVEAKDFMMNGKNIIKVDEQAKDLSCLTASLIDDLSLAPALRTEYYRTAFEDPKHGDYRASLDQNVTLIKEGSKLGEGDAWARVPEGDDAFVFPFAVLELKIATHALESVSKCQSYLSVSI